MPQQHEHSPYSVLQITADEHTGDRHVRSIRITQGLCNPAGDIYVTIEIPYQPWNDQERFDWSTVHTTTMHFACSVKAAMYIKELITPNLQNGVNC